MTKRIIRCILIASGTDFQLRFFIATIYYQFSKYKTDHKKTRFLRTSPPQPLETKTVICKVGAVDKCDIGLPDGLKVCPGCNESCCNPALQAQILNEWGAELNVLVGLCVGHDAIFTRHSKAPVTTFIVKDRVLGHNPAAALYTAKFYYKCVLDEKTFPEPRGEAVEAEEAAKKRKTRKK